MADLNELHPQGQYETGQDPQTSPSFDTAAHSKEVLELLSFLESFHKGVAGEKKPWTDFNLTPAEYKSLWSLIEKQESLHGYLLDKLRYSG